AKCQKCLQTGHFTFQCKNNRVYLFPKKKADLDRQKEQERRKEREARRAEADKKRERQEGGASEAKQIALDEAADRIRAFKQPLAIPTHMLEGADGADLLRVRDSMLDLAELEYRALSLCGTGSDPLKEFRVKWLRQDAEPAAPPRARGERKRDSIVKREGERGREREEEDSEGSYSYSYSYSYSKSEPELGTTTRDQMKKAKGTAADLVPSLRGRSEYCISPSPESVRGDSPPPPEAVTEGAALRKRLEGDEREREIESDLAPLKKREAKEDSERESESDDDLDLSD
ncbi:hypothetical protein KIPB_010626, partial [Kipferlia bialata]